jgi:hypothetical protein
MSDEQRLEQLKRKREASLQFRGGPPLGGYEKRVAAIDAEIARIEERMDG